MISYPLVAFGQPLVRREGPLPEPRGSEILLRVAACGVCHSDVHLTDGYFDLGNGRRIDLAKGRELPLILGHEIAGEVVACGSDAVGIAVGDRRVVYPWVGCGVCAVCMHGDEHQCTRPQQLGVNLSGGFADHALVPHPRYLFDYGSASASLAATYACSGLTAYSALRKVAPPDDAPRSLLLVGLGGVGLAAVSLAKAVGPFEIVGADIDDVRLTVARERGVAETVNTQAPDAEKIVKRRTGGGVAAAIDFVGSRQSASFAVGSLAVGGTLVVVGLFGGALNMPLPLLPLKQLSIRGSYVGSLQEMAALMLLVRSGHVPALPVTERLLTEAQQSLDDLRAGRVVGRVVLRP